MADLKQAEAICLGNDVWKYPRILSPELCEKLIDRYDQDPRKSYRGHSENDAEFDNRRGQMLFISDLPEWRELDQEIYQAIHSVFRAHFKRYRYLQEFSDEGYDLGCYLPPGEGCAEHFDSGNRVTRVASLLVYLNDVRYGGETIFPRQGIRVSPEQGMALVFPPFYTHPHHAVPPQVEPRYFLVTWANAKA
jgi:hypothetical protein